jgi:hypothetical protein
MEVTRIPKLVMEYKPIEKRSIECPKKRWKDHCRCNRYYSLKHERSISFLK